MEAYGENGEKVRYYIFRRQLSERWIDLIQLAYVENYGGIKLINVDGMGDKSIHGYSL